jgi:hypothetical protein
VTAIVYVAGLLLVATVAWLVASPLLGGARTEAAPPAADVERYRLEKEKELAYAAIKEAEFDFQMGKLSEADYHLLREKYEGRALAALAALEHRA